MPAAVDEGFPHLEVVEAGGATVVGFAVDDGAEADGRAVVVAGDAGGGIWGKGGLVSPGRQEDHARPGCYEEQGGRARPEDEGGDGEQRGGGQGGRGVGAG